MCSYTAYFLCVSLSIGQSSERSAGIGLVPCEMDEIPLYACVLRDLRQTGVPIHHKAIYGYLTEYVIIIDPFPPHDITSESHSVLYDLSVLQKFVVHRTVSFGESLPEDHALILL